MGERIDELTAPPVVGRFYIVPTVFYPWHGFAGDWPVTGPKHSDADFFDFKPAHFHVDARFVNWPDWAARAPLGAPKTIQSMVSQYPLFWEGAEFPPVVWRRRKCRRELEGYPFLGMPQVNRLQDHYAGTEAPLVNGIRICPHRGAPLSSLPAVDGCVTCPLHGLRFDAATWIARS